MTFYRDWFKQNQQPLLELVNGNDFVRTLLGVDTDKELACIDYNSYAWWEEENRTATQRFYSYAPIGKRAYAYRNALKNLNNAIHVPIIDSLRIPDSMAATTSTYYSEPNATVTVAGDGCFVREGREEQAGGRAEEGPQPVQPQPHHSVAGSGSLCREMLRRRRCRCRCRCRCR